jgi:hypothetical protein
MSDGVGHQFAGHQTGVVDDLSRDAPTVQQIRYAGPASSPPVSRSSRWRVIAGRGDHKWRLPARFPEDSGII